MAKQLTSQRYILKIHTGRLKKSKWRIKLTVDEARRNQELIALADSQVLRFIDQINGLENNEEKVHEVKKELKELRDNPEKHNTYKQIKKKQDELDKLLFKKDYVCVVIDSDKDYDIVYKEGFYINDVKYRRLLATTGGVKNSTVVFVNDEIYPELIRRIHNDRDMSKEFAPPKLEAYMALSCSASTPVSMPKGIAVVSDCFTKFKEDIIYLSYKEKYDIEPCMEEINDYEFELNGSDGFGLGHPSLMKRWSKDLHLDYLMSACVIRNSFCKGVTACFDFREVGRDLGVETITDVWGNVHNINDIELILTESMLKLWSSYSSIDDYLEKCEKNGYTFSVTKAAVKELENERNMNYQFLQGYSLTDNELEELINPTVKEIRDIVSGDYSKLLLYLKGTGMTERSASNLGKDFTDALMIDKRMLNDPFVKSKVNNMIKKRIDDAKIGVLSVRGAYSIVIGDPYALCEHIFGFEPVGLLKKEEVYSEYWLNHGAKEICCYRAPQTVSNNIRKMNVVSNKKMRKYYRYLHSIMVLNVHDSTCAAMNGMDFDGDAVISTDNEVLLKNTKNLRTIVCDQSSAPKCVPTEDDFFNFNKLSFGNEVGKITNRVTSMMEVMERFDKGSEEYKILSYRAMCGQKLQQDSIDAAKGCEVRPMALHWYSEKGNFLDKDKEYTEEEIAKNELNRRICADKKPYFMKYIYPTEKNKYDKYIKNVNDKCLMQFRKTLNELLETCNDDLTKEERTFLEFFKKKIPLGVSRCMVNRICWKIEEEFDGKLESYDTKDKFDYSILKSGVEYSKADYNKVKKLYEEYKKCFSDFAIRCKKERIDEEEYITVRSQMKTTFENECVKLCQDKDALCDIVLDICYKSNNSKQFAWDLCGEVFIKNLLKKNDYKIRFPKRDKEGKITFKGETFSMKTIELKQEEE